MSCNICLEELNSTEINKCNKCNIIFHKECLLEWFIYKGKIICPICREKNSYSILEYPLPTYYPSSYRIRNNVPLTIYPNENIENLPTSNTLYSNLCVRIKSFCITYYSLIILLFLLLSYLLTLSN